MGQQSNDNCNNTCLQCLYTYICMYVCMSMYVRMYVCSRYFSLDLLNVFAVFIFIFIWCFSLVSVLSLLVPCRIYFGFSLKDPILFNFSFSISFWNLAIYKFQLTKLIEHILKKNIDHTVQAQFKFLFQLTDCFFYRFLLFFFIQFTTITLVRTYVGRYNILFCMHHANTNPSSVLTWVDLIWSPRLYLFGRFTCLPQAGAYNPNTVKPLEDSIQLLIHRRWVNPL